MNLSKAHHHASCVVPVKDGTDIKPLQCWTVLRTMAMADVLLLLVVKVSVISMIVCVTPG